MIVYPTRDRILVRRDLEPERKGSIYIPSQWYVPSKDPAKRAVGVSHIRRRPEPQTGHVLALGPRVRELEGGEHVLFGKYAGTTYPVVDAHDRLLEILLIMHEADVWAVLDD